MIKEYIGEANDLLEATRLAKEGLVATLNLKNEDDIQIEVICDYKKKTLGLFGGTLATVKAFIELPDPAPQKKKAEPKKAEKKAEVKKEKPVEKKSDTKSTEPDITLISSDQFDPATSVAKASEYIKTVMTKLGCENVTVMVGVTENGIYLQLDGDKLGVVIGRRGETLDALQYLTSLAANIGNGYQKVTLNIGNYREKRSETLQSLAKRISAQVLSTGRSRTLEPMNPYERRIIHTAVQEIEGVVSHSVGEGNGRRVVISSENGERRPHDNRGSRRMGDRRPSQTVASPDREPKKDSAEIPLYGRIK